MNALDKHLNTQKLELARLESDILTARKDTEVAEADAINASTALALAQKRASIALLAAEPSAPQRKAAEIAATAAFSLTNVVFALQLGLHFLTIIFFTSPFLKLSSCKIRIFCVVVKYLFR